MMRLDMRKPEGVTMAERIHTDTDTGRYIQANGLDMYYQEHGPRHAQPLLLIHGGILTSDSWRPYLPAFAEQYRVITPDSRGHGRTNNSTGSSLSFGLLADDMVAPSDALDLHKPLIIGYSDGGQVALEIGMRHPDLPGALVIGGAYAELTEPSSKWVRSILGDEQSPNVDLEKFERENPDFAAGLRQDHGPERWKTLLKQIKPMWNARLNYTSEDFAKVTAPTLVLLGDRDGFVPVEEGVRMYRLLPNAELAVVPAADHMHFIFSPAKIAVVQPIILDFLQRHTNSN